MEPMIIKLGFSCTVMLLAMLKDATQHLPPGSHTGG